ncbi:MAG: hypothetical protein KJS73_08770 [Gammaproteobacteria bacterium]|nr:hypothetical protein [Gammaproteobacteria bacterium]
MAYAISLYDALVSINVPKPQALAVVESLEQTMTSELTTKTDLQQLRDHTDREFVAVRADIQQLRADMNREFAAVRAEMARGFEEQTQGRAADVALLRSEMNVAISRASMRSTLFMMGWTSLLFAAIQFLGS